LSAAAISILLAAPEDTNLLIDINTQLRSFLGLANYFKDFVPNHSNVVSPLFKMVDHSAKKQAALKWTPEGEKAFTHVRSLIANSPTLYFIENNAPIYLMTDASDYGIGGYLYQVINDTKQLIALVRKSLTQTQLAWSAMQKEAYAIFFCCTHLDNLLRV
jgi:RNase H-like domain found in reverse transcriptase